MWRLSHLIISDLGILFIQQAKQNKIKWRSKQNTYHVVNKNIAPSKVTDERRRKRGCHPGIPKLRLLIVLEYYLGVPWESPRLGSCHSLFHSPSNLYPKLENFTTQNLTENSWAPLAKENKTPLQGTVMNSLFIYIGVKPTVFQLLYGSYPPILAIDSSK